MFETIGNFFHGYIETFLSFVNGFVETVSNIWRLLVHYFQGLGDFFKAIPQAVTVLTESISYLPPILIAFADFSIVITIAFLILNRQEGG